MLRDKLLSFLEGELKSFNFEDSSKNGLQVEGKKNIKSVLFSVSASLSLIRKAAELKADAIIVHHGLLWGKEERIEGVYAQKIKILLENEINFFAWHLPLDANKKYGNNIKIINLFGPSKIYPFGIYGKNKIGFKAILKKELSLSEACSIIKEKINDKALILKFGPKKIRKIAAVSGGGQGLISQAVQEGADLYITGEASEYCYETSRENNLNFAAAGHYASEKFGVKALQELVSKKFKLKTYFYDSQNPI
ncbi:MAG: Nif3-like dinuclear metal center hexameric protein [Elusimicrobia bacterium]|nr:Nif3-like dinuclear metal center hexameric protein [Elusimicrobiota bacterium]